MTPAEQGLISDRKDSLCSATAILSLQPIPCEPEKEREGHDDEAGEQTARYTSNAGFCSGKVMNVKEDQQEHGRAGCDSAYQSDECALENATDQSTLPPNPPA